ncbi:MAG: succinate dehydrogenase assembly factor 2 [Proteobacteria bacterium]|nr:succinate dehydrogenase assembly factor 2 [Pseudomonadota bacterium]
MSVEAARLRWRCRRGMRELDQLLGWWLDHRYSQSGATEQAAFAALLDEQDPQLWDWFGGRSLPHRGDWQRIVDEIRSRDCA